MNKSTLFSSSLPYLPWLLSASVSLLAVYVWGHSFGWHFRQLNAYQFFPVLGLLGFSIMWSHYITGAFKGTLLKGVDLRNYFRFTSYAVLAAIVLHPGILIYQRFHDGYGLPPHSYESYVAPGRGWVTLLGSVSLLAFLAFEFHRLYEHKSWWKYVVSAGDAAMLAIFYHGLRLGSQLQSGWFRSVWWLYGLSLIVVISHKYFGLLASKKPRVSP